jgi:hypothetical protein
VDAPLISTHHPLVNLVVLRSQNQNQLYFAHSILRDVQIRIGFILEHTDRSVQFKPICLQSVAFANALIIGQTSECLACESPADVHYCWLIGKTR